MNSFARPDSTTSPMPEPAICDRTAALIRAPISFVPSAGSDTIIRRPMPEGHQRHGVRHARAHPGHRRLDPVRGARVRRAPVLELLAGDVEQRPALLLRAGQERDAHLGFAGHLLAVLHHLAAEAHARPAAGEGRRSASCAGPRCATPRTSRRPPRGPRSRTRPGRRGSARRTCRPRWSCRTRSAPPAWPAPSSRRAHGPRTPAWPRRGGRRCSTGSSTWSPCRGRRTWTRRRSGPASSAPSSRA